MSEVGGSRRELPRRLLCLKGLRISLGLLETRARKLRLGSPLIVEEGEVRGRLGFLGIVLVASGHERDGAVGFGSGD